MMTRNKYIELAPTPLLKWFVKYPMGGILIHWMFQSILYMDRTEKTYKLCLDGLLTFLIGFFLKGLIPDPYNWVCSFLIAHSLNFLFNSHFWALLKHYGLIYTSEKSFSDYSSKLFEQIKFESSLGYAAVYGSAAQGEWSPYSDLDIRLVRKAGWVNAIRACTFTLFQRSRSFFFRFPLDVYVVDSMDALKKMRVREVPVEIKR
jgi:hypothetical protein